jgi:hypothetical protein
MNIVCVSMGGKGNEHRVLMGGKGNKHHVDGREASCVIRGGRGMSIVC